MPHQPRISLIGLLVVLATATSLLGARAEILVTNLNVATAIYDGGPTNIPPTTLPAPDYALGHSFNLEFTPTPDDLSGTVVLVEIGGTANGTGIYLIDGVPTYVTKHNSGDPFVPASLFDTSVRPDAATRGEAAVTNSFGSLLAGTNYSVGVTWNQAGQLQFAVQTAVTGKLDNITFTGFFNNWAGDRSFSVALNPRTATPAQSVGGLAGEVAGAELGPPWDVESDANVVFLKGFAGTLTRAIYWNQAGSLGPTSPPPATVVPPGSRFFVTSVPQDYVVAEGSPATAISTGSDPIRVGGNTASPVGGRNSIFIFPLPRLGPLTNLLHAEVAFTVANTVGDPAGFNGDLWAIGIQSNTTPLVEYCQGDTDPADPTNVKLHDNLLTAPITDGTILTSTNAGLRTLIQNFYNANPGYPGGQFLFLRLNPDAAPGAVNNAWNVSAGDGTRPPILTLYVQNTNAPDVATRPNFVFIISDDQRDDALGVVQREQGAAGRFPWFTNGTPALDRLASEGLRFRNAFVVQSVCSASRAAMLTGVYNHINGIENNFTRFPVDATTYAQLLREKGYRTGLFGKYHMTGTFVDRPGFDDAISFAGLGNYFGVNHYFNGFPQSDSTWVDDKSTDHALDFLEANRTNHFAMVLGFKSPHGPFEPPARHAGLYAGETIAVAPSLNSLAPYRTAPATAGAETLRNYFRCITGLDDNVGRVLDKLDQLNLATNTVVIFISDNGFLLDEHGLTVTKWAAYEPSIRTALLVRYPPLITAGQVSDDLVLNMDLMPTILELAGISVPTNVQGRSLAPIMAGTTPPDWRQDFLYENFRDNPPNPNPVLFAVRNHTNKLIIYPGHPEWTEMFNFVADPYETNNLANQPAFAALGENLNTRLHQLLDETGLKARLESPVRAGSEFQFTVRGGIGPIYQVTTSTNLQAWSPGLQFKMTSGETNVVVPNEISAAEYYRLEMLSD